MTAPAYHADGRPVGREAFYALACDPRRSVVVEACAGAGKTWMLVSRILRALVDGAEPHEILAITYTRKAAGEMRERLNAWLRDYGTPACDAATQVRALVERGLPVAEAERLVPRLGRLRARVLGAGRPVEIRTFHAWFAQVLRAAPLEALAELGLTPDVELLEDPSDHRLPVFRRFHAAVLADPALRSDYEALVGERGRSQVRKWLETAWDRHVEVELADRAGVLATSVPLPPGVEADDHPARALLEPAWVDALAALADAFPPNLRAQQAAEALRAALAEGDAVRRYRQVRLALYTKDDDETRRRQIGSFEALDRAWDRLDALDRLVRQFEAHHEHGRMVRLSRVLLAAYAAHKRARGLADMQDLERAGLALLGEATLAGWVQERLDARVRHLLIDEFQDTSPLQWHALRAWLDGYGGAGGGASGQRPPGVFIVGDPKQSIYRFRRAEPRVFGAARRFVVDALDGIALACDHTRRNAPEVLGALNAVFGEAAAAGQFADFRPHTTELPELREGTAGSAAASDAASASGATTALPVAAVERFPIVPRPTATRRKKDETAPPPVWRDTLTTPRLEPERVLREQEAAQVAASIAARVAAGEVARRDVLVLCRKRESLRLVADALHARGVACSAIEDAALMDLPEARDLVALVDALVSPRHRLSIAQALRSPVFGASDADLLALAALAERDDWWEALLRGRWDDGPIARPALARARRLLTGWRVAAAQLPPHDLLDRIVHEGEVRERVAAAVPPLRRVAALAAIDAVLAEALTRDGARYATPYGFVRTLKRDAVKARPPAEADAVQLLTVHGAKGLEADTVHVVDSDPEPRNPDTATLLVDWPVEAATPTGCAFVYSETRCPPSLEAAVEAEVEARRREELNGLYVAMSRARRRLVFSATAPSKRADDRSWWDRVEAVATPVEPPVAVSGPAASSAARPIEGRDAVPVEVSDALPAGGSDVLPAASSGTPLAIVPVLSFTVPRRAPIRRPPADADAARDASRRLGQAVHRLLEWAAAPVPSPADDPAVFDSLAEAAAAEFRVSTSEVRRLGQTILTSAACAPFFAADLAWAGNEVSVTEAGEVLRIDRLVRVGAEWWVLDYKLQHAPEALEAYREQLRRYRRAVARAEPGAAVRCAFITGAGALVEVDGPSP